MSEKMFMIESLGKKHFYRCKDKNEAYALFFADVVKGEIGIDEVSFVILLHDEEGEMYPLRTLPTLVNLGLIKFEDAVYVMSYVLKIDAFTAEIMLEEAMKTDKWISDRVCDVLNLDKEGGENV